jgi:hypothetical protein
MPVVGASVLDSILAIAGAIVLIGTAIGILRKGVRGSVDLVRVVVAAARAPRNALDSVVPMLRAEVASAVVELPPAYADERLTGPALGWIRGEFDVMAFAVRRPGDSKWAAGGKVSNLPLPATTELALVGEQADIEIVRSRLDQAYRSSRAEADTRRP